MELKGKNFIPLLSVVFNKVFSQLSVLRINLTDRKMAREEFLSDLSRRFEYIFINALLTFTKDGLVVNTNVATGARASIVRSFSEFSKYDRTLSRNMAGVMNVEIEEGRLILSSQAIVRLRNWLSRCGAILSLILRQRKRIRLGMRPAV